jgi:uncharacterized membrane protein YbhN (UPF0104 family)
MALGAAAAILIAYAAIPPWATSSGWTLAVVGALAATLAAVVAFRGQVVLQRLAAAAGGRSRGISGRLVRLATEAISGSRALRSGRASAAVAGLSAATVALAASTNYLLFRAFALDVPPIGAVLLLVTLQVGNTLVSVPGNIGVFHAVTVLTLGFYSVDRDVALAYAVALYAVALLPKIAVGGLLLSLAPQDLMSLDGVWRKSQWR